MLNIYGDQLIMKKDLKVDIENEMYKNTDNIASLIPYLLEGVGYSLQIDAKPLLRKYIAAAIYKYKQDDIAFEDILDCMDIEDYSDEKSYSQHEMVRHVIVNSAVGNTKIINEYLKNNNAKKGNMGLFFVAMVRLSTSFKAATLLLNNGFFIEVVSVFRLILEQLAWGSFLLVEEDDEKVRKNRTQSNVKYLKEQLGEKFGALYGDMSSVAHLEPNEIGRYLQNDENEQIAVRDRSGKECEGETRTLLELFDGYCDLLWKGINHFGIVEEEIEYYTDWHELNIYIVMAMQAVLNNKAKINGI